ncbi:MAG: hypothetical protein IT166_03400 [Bryobacterales bacterium]|nr:hypothetical protein [Bryobacterales bacterium]
MKPLLVLLASAAGVFGQTVPPPIPAPYPGPPLIELKQYLTLTDAQYVQLFDNLDQSRRAAAGFQQRIYQLRREIDIETERPNPDPMELGTRYAEIEHNCRAITNESKALREKNSGLLTDAQKAKLKTLDDARKLYPVISQAQLASLLEGGVTGLSPGGVVGGIISTIPPTIVPVAGCAAPFPGRIIPAASQEDGK